MEKYQVKCKLMNGKPKYGIIDDELNVVKSFTCDQIIEKNGVFILKCENEPDEVFYDGKMIIQKEDDFHDIQLVSGGNYWFTFAVKKPSNGYGIIERNKEGKGESIEYPFGKANQIVIDDSGKVLLYKKMKTKTGKGVWNDPQFGTLDPIYEDFQYKDIDLPYYPKMPDASRTFVDPDVSWHFLENSFGSENKFSRKVELVFYSKKISGKKKYGVMTKQYDQKKSGYHEVYTFQDFIKDKDSVWMDDKHQCFVCKTKKNGTEYIDLIPYTYDWKIYTKGACVYGRPVLSISFQFEEKIEDYSFIPDSSYLKAKVNGKWGVFEVFIPRDHSPYDHHYAKGRYCKVIDFCYDSPEDIEYCSDEQFILKDGDHKKAVKFYKEASYLILHTKSIVSDSYPNIEKFHDGYQITTEDGKKRYGKFCYQYRNHEAHRWFDVSEKEYLALSQYGDVIQGFTELKDDQKRFDMMASPSKVIVSDVSRVSKHYNDSSLSSFLIECLLTNGNIVVFDKQWNQFLEAKDVTSYTYIPNLNLFNITHNNGTHSLVPSDTMGNENRKVLEPIFGTYDQVSLECNQKGPKNYTVIVSVKTGNPEQPYCAQEYSFECSGWDGSIQNFNKVFEGNIVDCLPLPEINRTILTVFDPKDEKNVVGVIENKKGNVSIPFEFDSITWNPPIGEEIGQFVGCVKDETTYFDQDGYYLPEMNQPSNKDPKKKEI